MQCPVRASLNVIGGKWKLPILWFLQQGTKRYSELQRLISPITPKMLAQQLRELERDSIIKRTVFPVVPPRVEYEMTAYGRTLQPMLKVLSDWGNKHCKQRGGPA
jgi:DNA-binding HxlR family transcriptional regulator